MQWCCNLPTSTLVHVFQQWVNDESTAFQRRHKNNVDSYGPCGIPLMGSKSCPNCHHVTTDSSCCRWNTTSPPFPTFETSTGSSTSVSGKSTSSEEGRYFYHPLNCKSSQTIGRSVSTSTISTDEQAVLNEITETANKYIQPVKQTITPRWKPSSLLPIRILQQLLLDLGLLDLNLLLRRIKQTFKKRNTEFLHNQILQTYAEDH